MQILNIAGYKFVPLSQLENLKQHLVMLCDKLALKGTILLSHEGINLSLAGDITHVKSFQTELTALAHFSDMRFHETYSATIPFQRLKVKLKKEIITLKQPSVDATTTRAPSIAPEILKTWLDEKRDITLLDTRNNYEVEMGTFATATNLHLSDFSEFPTSVSQINKEKPLVMFCTGGIRCEKAALYLLEQGFDHVYQLDGGILGYFAKVGKTHFNGECFVFDERIALNNEVPTQTPPDKI